MSDQAVPEKDKLIAAVLFDQAVPEMDEKTQELIAAVLFVYNSYLNKEYGLDQMFGYEEDPLRNFLHTKTPGVPATFPDFFHELKFHYPTIKARMEREAKEGWVCDLVFDENTSEVGKALGPSSKKRRVAREDESEDDVNPHQDQDEDEDDDYTRIAHWGQEPRWASGP